MVTYFELSTPTGDATPSAIANLFYPGTIVSLREKPGVNFLQFLRRRWGAYGEGYFNPPSRIIQATALHRWVEYNAKSKVD
jgi:hypothetical protein